MGFVGTLTRRVSQRHPNQVVFHQPPPPDYPSIADGRSFNMDDFVNSDSEEDTFTTQAPPNYLDIVGPGGANIG